VVDKKIIIGLNGGQRRRRGTRGRWPGWPDWANFRSMGVYFFEQVLCKLNECSQHFLAAYFHCIHTLCINLSKKWIGQHFGWFFQKHIWSFCRWPPKKLAINNF
jgi:hypothetical protein